MAQARGKESPMMKNIAVTAAVAVVVVALVNRVPAIKRVVLGTV